MTRAMLRVTTKAAIFNGDNHVLMIHMDFRDGSELPAYGLPGGHIDEGETPDEAMVRELTEETGLTEHNYTLRHADFFMHEEGKLVVAFVGRATTNALKSRQANHEGVPVWVSKAQFAHITTNPCYRTFVNEHWPSA